MKQPQIVVAGSGKMARDVGLYFLGCGHPVAWLSRDCERLAKLRKWIQRRVHHLSKLYEEEGNPKYFGTPTFFMVGDPSMPQAEVFIESVNEAEEDKRALLLALDSLIPHDAIRVSNSSSIFPDALHMNCAGLHFFYPVELTGFVEAVFPEGFSAERRQRLLTLLRKTKLKCIEEESSSAFAVNRLLLPLQSEVFRCLRDGCHPEIVDRASTSPALPVGQLTLMDTIGLDVVHPAVGNFMGRMEQSIADQYRPLRDGLERLLNLGKKGRKNRNGLLVGDPLPWSLNPVYQEEEATLARRFCCLFVNTCYHAIEQDLLSSEQLELALASLFDWTGSVEEALPTMSLLDAYGVLRRSFERTERPYFIPAKFLRAAANDERGWRDQGPVI